MGQRSFLPNVADPVETRSDQSAGECEMTTADNPSTVEPTGYVRWSEEWWEIGNRESNNAAARVTSDPASNAEIRRFWVRRFADITVDALPR
jgi:hypothetical protein